MSSKTKIFSSSSSSASSPSSISASSSSSSSSSISSSSSSSSTLSKRNIEMSTVNHGGKNKLTIHDLPCEILRLSTRQCQLFFDSANKIQKMIMLSSAFTNISMRLKDTGIFKRVRQNNKRNKKDICVLVIIWQTFADICDSKYYFPQISIYNIREINKKDRALVKKTTKNNFVHNKDIVILQTLLQDVEKISMAAIFKKKTMEKYFT